MMNAELHTQLTDLFNQAGRAHHAAFLETNGEDPEWPIWYADRLQGNLSAALCRDFSKSQLIYCLMNADFEHAARAPETDWKEFYASEFIEHYECSETAETDQLALYYMPTCPFCRRVLQVIDRLGVDVELRNTTTESDRRRELIDVRGRATVPVLWIKSPEGDVRWMPESADIIRYLEKMYG